ncbi:MAG: DnaD domain protein [Clostridia bacterium]|nr:DnaD domain protein [Clostridia bacterium]
MKIEIKYTGSILNLPSCVADLAKQADEVQLRVILSLFNYVQYFSDFENQLPIMAEGLEIDVSQLKSALAFWVKGGAISIDGLDLDTPVNTTTHNNVLSNQQPTFTGKQIIAFTERNKDFGALCKECQSIMQKTFTTVDYNNVLHLKEYYGFSDEYVLLLIEHCVEVDKASWAYIRKTASNLYDEGVNSYSRLEEHFSARKNKRSNEYKIRKLLGIGDREFTKREKGYVEKWLTLKTNFELIKRAYEITVDKTGTSSLAYMAKILENWHTNGLTTIESVDKQNEGYKKKQQQTLSSFDTDDFFEAALKRSEEKLLKGKKK